MDAMLDMVRNIGSPVEPLSIDILEQNMCSGKSRKEKRDGCLAAPSMLTLTMCNPGSQWNNGEPTQAICQTGPSPNRVHQQLRRVPHADDHQLRDPEAIRLLRALHNGELWGGPMGRAARPTLKQQHDCDAGDDTGAHTSSTPPPWQGMSDLGVGPFCQRFVDPMDEESDHVHIVALTNALQAGCHGPSLQGPPLAHWLGEPPGRLPCC